jgi:O-antigen/teichoic acid export membrane protein
MSKVRKSILFSLGQNYASFALQFAVSIILARLLNPSEIGLYSIAAVLIGFASSMRDFGISSYIIQERDLTPDKIRAAFTLTLFTAWTLALVILLGSNYLRHKNVHKMSENNLIEKSVCATIALHTKVFIGCRMATSGLNV